MNRLSLWAATLCVIGISSCGDGGSGPNPPPQPPANLAPTADAGLDQTVDEGDTVNLTGSGTDSDGTIASYQWSQTSGTSVSISDGDTANASFIAPMLDQSEDLVFSLAVTDDDGAVATDSVTVTVNDIPDPPPPPNQAPVPNAGPDQAVDEGSVVNLAGSATDADGSISSYLWRQESGSVVSIQNADSPTASFVAPEVAADESLTLSFTVTDDDGASATDLVTVSVRNVNVPPTANAGADQVVDEGSTVSLQGAGSDSDGTISSFAWLQTSGTPVTVIGADSASASFVAPDVNADETLAFSLTVTDNDGASATDSIVVTVSNVNAVPTADAGPDQIVEEGASVSLQGAGSDSDGSIASFEWQQTSGTVVSISDANLANASFTAPMVTADETLVFNLTVIDNDGASNSDSVTITVTNVNVAPTADAGADQIVVTGDQINLSGSGSTDPDGDVLTFSWLLVQTPDSSTAQLTGAASETPTLVADLDGVYVAELTVNDGTLSSEPVSVSIYAVTPNTAYKLIDLETLGGSSSQAYDINETRGVVGWSRTTGDTFIHAFIEIGNGLQDLGTLGGNDSRGFDINDGGQVVGYSHISGNTATRAFLYDAGAMQDLGTLGGTTSQAFGINNGGQIVGFSYVTGNSERHAFLYEEGVMQDIGTLGGSYAVGRSINKTGQIAGFGYTAGDAAIHAFFYDGNSMLDIGTLGGSESHAIDINESGNIAGYSWLAGDVERHAFLYDGSELRTLGTLGGLESYGFGINDLDQVVGESFISGNTDRAAFLYADDEMKDLCALSYCRMQGWDALNRADNINNSGDIVGYGLINGQQHAFVALASKPVAVEFTDRSAFYSQLGSVVIDDYESSGYTASMTDAEMSAVLSETQYSVINGDPNFPSHIINPNNANAFSNAWCNGCNLDTRLDFTATSVGDTVGVNNVGFDIVLNGDIPYEVFVTFGDGSVRKYQIPELSGAETANGLPYKFWGLSTPSKISSIELRSTSTGSFSTAIVLDNLVIGSSGRGVDPPPLQSHGSP